MSSTRLLSPDDSPAAGLVFEAHRLLDSPDDSPAGGLVFKVEGSGCIPVMCSSSEAGSYLTLIDSCITQLQAQGPSRTCNQSIEEEEDSPARVSGVGSLTQRP